MAYSESLARRIRHELAGDKRIEEKKMFGGVGFLLRGNMCVGVWKDSLIARVGSEQYEQALSEPHVAEFDITGRAMKGWVMVDADGIDAERRLQNWIERSVQFVLTLPAKR